MPKQSSYQKNPDKYRKYTREYNAKRRQIPEVREQRNKQARIYRLAQFGITEKDFEMLMEEQDGVCAICGRPPLKNALNVDHEHQKQEKKRSPESRKPRIRGLLCHRCNRALGLFGNSVEQLLLVANNFVEYIEKYYAKRLADSLGVEESTRRAENVAKYFKEFEKRKPK